MCQNVKVSVVIPIRNTKSAFLNECLCSIEKQSLSDIEVICVDDCSDNQTTIITLQAHKSNDKRIKIIHNDRPVGAGIARNTGMKYAKGEYIIFLDSDDTFEDSFLEEMYNKIVYDNNDVCVCGYSSFVEKNGTREVTSVISIKDVMSKFDDEYMLYVETSPCNKLCRLEYLNNNNIRFQDLTSDNDVYYAFMTVFCTDRISFLRKSNLFYYRNGTESQISNKRNPFNLLTAINSVKKSLISLRKYTAELNNIINVYIITIGSNDLKNNNNDELKERYYDFIRYHICQDGIIVNSRRASILINNWTQYPFKCRWFESIGDYYKQLFEKKVFLIRRIKETNNIYIWGRGKRASAFEAFCKDNDIHVDAVCDISDTEVGSKDSYGNCVISCNDVIGSHGLIIASNHQINDYLVAKYSGIIILDLEDYCPL